jgi:hypothetical protein
LPPAWSTSKNTDTFNTGVPKSTDVSEEHVRVEVKQETGMKKLYLTYSSALKMEATFPPNRQLNFNDSVISPKIKTPHVKVYLRIYVIFFIYLLNQQSESTFFKPMSLG